MNFDIYALCRRGPQSTDTGPFFYYRSYRKRDGNREIWTEDIKRASIWVSKSVPNQIKKRMLKEDPYLRSSDVTIVRFTAVYQSENE